MQGISSQWEKIKSHVLVDRNIFPRKSYRFTAIYSRDREYLLVFTFVLFGRMQLYETISFQF